mmetsp:Transcript_46614/g.92051  ORF Transcript_46614/g.92051 Transcript_46614/m.92051 type:complete len:227 (+) Transcript_46614:17-697(+)
MRWGGQDGAHGRQSEVMREERIGRRGKGRGREREREKDGSLNQLGQQQGYILLPSFHPFLFPPVFLCAPSRRLSRSLSLSLSLPLPLSLSIYLSISIYLWQRPPGIRLPRPSARPVPSFLLPRPFLSISRSVPSSLRLTGADPKERGQRGGVLTPSVGSIRSGKKQVTKTGRRSEAERNEGEKHGELVPFNQLSRPVLSCVFGASACVGVRVRDAFPLLRACERGD